MLAIVRYYYINVQVLGGKLVKNEFTRCKVPFHTVFLRFNVRSTLSIIIRRCMSRNLTRQILHDLHSDCFAMVLTTGFYCDSWAHKVRVVKYIVVYGQIKAADKKYCHNQKWRRKLKEISFRTRGF